MFPEENALERLAGDVAREIVHDHDVGHTLELAGHPGVMHITLCNPMKTRELRCVRTAFRIAYNSLRWRNPQKRGEKYQG